MFKDCYIQFVRKSTLEVCPCAFHTPMFIPQGNAWRDEMSVEEMCSPSLQDMILDVTLQASCTKYYSLPHKDTMYFVE